jgi:hypothetical protein
VDAQAKVDNIQVPATIAKAALDTNGESKGQRHQSAKESGLSPASHPTTASGSSAYAVESGAAAGSINNQGSGVAVERQKQKEDDTMSVASVASTRSNRSTLSFGSVSSSVINDRIPARQREATRIQQSMKAFVRQMVRGQQMGVISPDGQLRTCTCSLDKRLKHYVIELKGSQRKIPLTSIAEVYQGTEPEDIDTPLDEFCSTLTLEQGECITFHFPDVPAREQFAMCLQLLVDGQH